jgi:flagellar FliJ protein
MTRTETAELLKRTREVRERSAARAVAEGMDTEAQERARLEAMEAWRNDYGAQQQARMRSGAVTAAEMARWQTFLEGLDRAIAAQRERVEGRAATTDARRSLWAQRRTEFTIAERFAERVHDEVRRLEEKREQAASDDAIRPRRNR